MYLTLVPLPMVVPTNGPVTISQGLHKRTPCPYTQRPSPSRFHIGFPHRDCEDVPQGGREGGDGGRGTKNLLVEYLLAIISEMSRLQATASSRVHAFGGHPRIGGNEATPTTQALTTLALWPTLNNMRACVGRTAAIESLRS